MTWVLLILFVHLVNCNEAIQSDGKLIFSQISGKQQAYDLGKFFRRRYDKFIGTYSPDKVYILSAADDGTINSANLVLAGLFPPEGDQIWNTNLLWQSIAVHEIPWKDDLLISAENCERYSVVKKEYKNSPEIRAFIDQYHELFQYLESHLGTPIRDLNEIRFIYDTLKIESESNKTLGDWTRKIFYPGCDLEYLAAYYPIISVGTTQGKRLTSGFLLKEILDRFKNKTLSMLPDQMMYIYSGSNPSISRMMVSLGVFYLHIPPHSSSLLFELYETNDDHYIQLFYRNSTLDDLPPLDIPGCGTKCPLNRWYELFGDILPEDETKCRISSEYWFLSVSLLNYNEALQSDGKLIFTQIIFRHGDRNIRVTYPNDPYEDKSHWPEGLGQLTKLGKRQAYGLGKFLRRRYDTFIGTYSPDKVSILSSDFDRTINSANLALAALFPPEGDQIWNKNLLWQPIAVHQIPAEEDYFIGAEEACERYVQAREEYENSPEIRAMVDAHRDLFEYLEMHTGKPIRTIIELREIFDNLDVESRINKTLPQWADEIFFPGGDFEYLAFYSPILATGTTELKKLRSGFLLKQILDRFRNKTLSILPDQLMQIYSGHEVTMSTMMNSLGIFKIHLPPHSSGLLFELYESNDDHYIQLFYKNSTSDDLPPLDIPGCGTKCPLNRWYELYRSILPEDVETECRSASESGSVSSLTSNFQYFAIIFGAHLVFSAIFNAF